MFGQYDHGMKTNKNFYYSPQEKEKWPVGRPETNRWYIQMNEDIEII
jgi:hypothetical protein